MSQKVTTGVRPTLRIADKNQIPATEPERQYYFMDIAKEYLRQLSEEKGNPLTFHVSTFGCQMNARDSEKLVLLSMQFRRIMSLLPLRQVPTCPALTV